MIKKFVIDHPTDRRNLCLKHIELGSKLPGCPKLRVRKGESKYYGCKCLSILDDSPDQDNRSIRESIADYMLYHLSKSPVERQRTIMDWIRYTHSRETLERRLEDNEARFLLPMDRSEEQSNGEEEDSADFFQKAKICKGALGFLLDFKHRKWKTMRDAVKNNIVPQHGNSGVSNRKKPFEKGVRNDLHQYLENLSEMEAAPVSTPIFREAVGSGLRGGEEGVVELPPSLTKRKLYIRFCEERGYKVKTSDNGRFEITEDRSKEQKPICAWGTFLNFWKKEFPKLRIRKPQKEQLDEEKERKKRRKLQKEQHKVEHRALTKP